MYRLVKSVLKEVEKVAIAALVWRMVTGAHWHGEKRTDAGWWTHGTKSKRHEFHQTGFMNKWEHTPRGHRWLWRWACFWAFTGIVYGLITATMITLNALGALVVYGLVVAAFTIEKKVRLRVHERTLVKPIVKSIAPLLRLSPHAVRRMLHLSPENIKDEGECGWFEFPPELTPSVETMSSMERIIDAHMPVDVELVAQFQQTPKLGVIKAGLKPPPMVVWDETVSAMRNAAYGDIIIGKDRHKQVFSANFIKLEDPHWAFNVQTKRGKSNFLGLVAVQVLFQDPLAQVIAIDPKEESLIDFLGTPWHSAKPLLPGVTMANDPENVEAMWAAIAKGRKLMEKRRADFARDRTKKYPICLVILDELNKFCHMTDEAWNAKLEANNRLPKEERELLPKRCPVYADILDMLHMGRFVGVHLIAVAQDFRASLLGGEARNGFGLRGLGGFIPSQWKMFIGTTPVPEPQGGVGRWIFWQGERQDWVQITHCDPDKAYAMAAENRSAFDADAALGYAETSVHATADTFYSLSSKETATDGHTIEPPAVRVVVGYREAAKLLGYNRWESFRRARDRWAEDHGRKGKGLVFEYRVGRSPAWPEDELVAWKRSLPRSKSVSD